MSDEIFRVEIAPNIQAVILTTESCQIDGHEQQVAYSTYHQRLTQTCFTEKLIIYNQGILERTKIA